MYVFNFKLIQFVVFVEQSLKRFNIEMLKIFVTFQSNFSVQISSFLSTTIIVVVTFILVDQIKHFFVIFVHIKTPTQHRGIKFQMLCTVNRSALLNFFFCCCWLAACRQRYWKRLFVPGSVSVSLFNTINTSLAKHTAFKQPY